jgi:hypothetical protein
LSALVLIAAGRVPPPVAGQARQALEIVVLSNRADLVSGGDALVEIRPAPETNDRLRVDLDGRDVTSQFAIRADGRYLGPVSPLRVGKNELTASSRTGGRARLTLTSHPRGGPLFSGQQVQPWACSTTDEPSLGSPVDAQCNAATRLRFVYRSLDGRFQPFDPARPLPPDIATLATVGGRKMPYIVRIERGTMNRGIHEIAVLFDPALPWTPWQRQPHWEGKLLLKYGAGTGQIYRQGTPGPVLDDDALRRGFVVATSSMMINGQHSNFVTAAETSLMLKEHVIETYGEVRYTIGEGGSGGALLQYLIADAYPGILDGLRPTQDWEDSISGAYREFADSAVVMQAIESSSVTYTDSDRAAIGGWGGTNVNIFNTESRRVGDYVRPDDGTKCAGDASYDPVQKPAGVRCTFQDFMASIIGRRADGAAHLVYDNVGVQYGLKAVEEGRITVEQFVDLNVRAGGFDRDGRWQPKRNALDPAVAARLYRSGHITQGRGLANVPILAIRGTNNDDYHYPFRTMVNRNRLVAANGHADNHVYWIQPPREVSTLDAMDRWLGAIAADRRPGALPAKVVRNKPPELTSGCWINGVRTVDLERCDREFPYEREPRTIAGDTGTISTMKCQLQALARRRYRVSFTDAQWLAMERAFPSGVCDFTKPGVGVQPTVPWLSYASGPGGQPLGPPPASRSVLPSGVRRRTRL